MIKLRENEGDKWEKSHYIVAIWGTTRMSSAPFPAKSSQPPEIRRIKIIYWMENGRKFVYGALLPTWVSFILLRRIVIIYVYVYVGILFYSIRAVITTSLKSLWKAAPNLSLTTLER